MAEATDPEMLVQMILLAAAQHNVDTLRTLLRNGSANVQDPDTGYTPLHAAIAACAPEDESSTEPRAVNGHADGVKSTAAQLDADTLEGACKTIRLLLQNGAIWNDLDKENETPGCIAYRLGLRELYDIMVDAGVRAEMLLSRLDEYERLEGEEEEDDEGGQHLEATGDPRLQEQSGGAEPDHDTILVAPTDDATTEPIQEMGKKDVNSADYLQSDLTYKDDRILDADNNGVMMAWEKDIMKRTAELLAPRNGLRILNIGHGMGIIDELFQSLSPLNHHIVEAHPTVITKLHEKGWFEKPDVVIHEGRWQDVVPKLIEENKTFDVIYFDTFAEDYKALREFFTEYVIGLLDQGIDGEGGRFGFFNGLGADRQVCYDVYSKVVEMDLFEAGFDTEWEEMTVPDLDSTGEWAGVRRKYWALDKYKLPVCNFIG
ncbi:MAG: Arginine N-methyltransferase 2 [Sclerophora amabilis]|nr:MAG: Arginine N-methyltransferase 2 [Sclerophora amabilis]